MDTKKDIESRHDIELFVRAFYEKIKQNEQIGFIFNNIVAINWEHHIPVITDFWDTILLDHPVYTKNAMAVHYDLNRIIPLKKEYFETWLTIFNAALDELFEGEIVNLAKTRAASIAAVMEFKMKSL